MSVMPSQVVESPAAPEIVIDVHGLTKSFGGRQVVRDLSMQVKRGTIFGFLGPNGSGKTTTIRSSAGCSRPIKAAARVSVTISAPRRQRSKIASAT